VSNVEARLLSATRDFEQPLPPAALLQAARKKVTAALARRKHTEIVLTGLGVPAPKLTKGGAPSTSSATLAELISSGAVRDHLARAQGAEAAAEAEVALAALSQVSALDTMLSSFILPLQTLPDSRGRVHSSLNLNTETGRLSSQRPNLQNQPALDKDRFLIRDLFTCEDGHALIVADYEQLELRLLAHMTGCKSMIEAFRLGGDFHSRTAMGMYPEIQDKVNRGELLIEREILADGTVDPAYAHIPLIKDAHATERKKAKVLNFSIAYGKTARG
jgi:DNA polymerase-1